MDSNPVVYIYIYSFSLPTYYKRQKIPHCECSIYPATTIKTQEE